MRLSSKGQHLKSRLIKSGWTSGHLVFAVTLIVITFIAGGSSRGDAVQLVFYRPFSVIMLFLAIHLTRYQEIRNNWFLALWLLSIVVFVFAHLVPLPPEIWVRFPGRTLIAELDQLVFNSFQWRPLTLSPELTRNAFWSLAAPLALFLLLIHLDIRKMKSIASVFIAMGLISGALAIIQISQGVNGGAYFYKITNFGLGVGLFANRNHQAVLLACMPIMAFYVISKVIQRAKERGFASSQMLLSLTWLYMLLLTLIFGLVVVTGSRSGLVLFALSVGCLFVWLSLKPAYKWFLFFPRQYQILGMFPKKARLVLTAAAVIPLFLFMVFSDSNNAFYRLARTTAATEHRLTIVDTLMAATSRYWPVGAGVGSFEPIFKIHEPDTLIAPTYWNHAHSDWIEVVLNGGVGALLILIAGILWLGRSYKIIISSGVWRSDFGVEFFTATNILAVLALSSIVDYPLRVPILSCLFVVSLVMISKLNSTIQSSSIDTVTSNFIPIR